MAPIWLRTRGEIQKATALSRIELTKRFGRKCQGFWDYPVFPKFPQLPITVAPPPSARDRKRRGRARSRVERPDRADPELLVRVAASRHI